MSSKLFIRGGIVQGVYDDRLLPIYAALGVVQIQRATTIEFNHDKKQWEARLCTFSAPLIASGMRRADVIKAEIEFLERGL
jgi:hypothetical protein